jgi:hypothetical protein
MLTDHMQPAFERLKERKIWQDNIHGYIRFTEVTPDSKEPEYSHPHYHVLLLVRPSMFEGVNSLTQSKWQDLWAECLGQMDTPAVVCKRVHVKPHQPLEAHLSRMVRYCTKPLHQDYEPEGAWLRTLIHQLRGVQLVTAGGAFWRVARHLMQDEQQQAAQEELTTYAGSVTSIGHSYEHNVDEEGQECIDVICPPGCTWH